MFWSSSLAQTFLSEISNGALLAAWSDSDQESESEELRRQLAHWSHSDASVRGWIVSAWRSARTELIQATERLSPEEISAKPLAWFRHLGPDQVLLSVLSEVAEDTAEDVAQVISGLPRGRLRSALRSRWGAWQDSPESRATKQIALVGGHPSESPRVRILEEKLGVQFKWTVAEKSKGLRPGHSSIGDLEAVEAMIVVTGNIGHSTMHCARKAAARLGVPCRYVKGITELSLRQCLEAMPLEGSQYEGRHLEGRH